MGNIVFLTNYDSVNIGVKSLQYQMLCHGHKSHIIYFKLACVVATDEIIENSLCYEYTINDKLYASNYDVDPWTEKEFNLLVDEINRLDPDVIALSCRSWFDSLAPQFVKGLRQQITKNIIIIAGGYGPSFNEKHYLRFCDYVFLGEGEDALVDFMNHFNKTTGKTMRVSNIAFREGRRLIKNELRPLKKSLGEYKVAAIEKHASLIQNNSVLPIDPVDINRTRYFLLAGRGCVGSCSYCSGGYWRSIYPTPIPKRRNRPMADIRTELLQVAELGFKYIQFVDEFFIFPRKELIALFEFMRTEIQLPFFCYLHPQMVVDYPEVLEWAVMAGLNDTIVAFQSGSPVFSKHIYHRKLKLETLCEFADRLHGYQQVTKKYHFITGNPLETEKVSFETFDLIKKLPFRLQKDTINAFKLNVFPASPLEKMLKDSGVEKEHVPTEKSFTYGLFHYLRLLVDDSTMDSLFQKYKDGKRPYELQKIVQAVAITVK